MALRDGHYEEEGWRIRKDGSRFWANVVITAVHDPAGAHVGFAKVTRDTTERRRLEHEREAPLDALRAANAELAVLNARLQQAADDQAQFLAVTAHELRTPVASRAAPRDLLTAARRRTVRGGARRRPSAAMDHRATRLQRLVDDLLTASRLQSSALAMQQDRVAGRRRASRAPSTRCDAAAPGQRDVAVAELPGAVTSWATRTGWPRPWRTCSANALRHGAPPVEVVPPSRATAC